MGPILTVKERCRKCYACVRNCPVKAIKVKAHYAEVIHSRCIGCGKCIAVCTQKAKVIADSREQTWRLLGGSDRKIAVLGCSYPAFFQDVAPNQLVSGLRRLGFDEVHQGAAGVELLSASYHQQMQQPGDTPLITSHCPTIVDLIERHYPQMLKNLLPVVSPMIAIGRFIKACNSAPVQLVYISSCIAGKFEIFAEPVADAIDVVLTYKELGQMFQQQRLDLTRLGHTPFDGLQPRRGCLFPISGGPFQVLDIHDDFFQPRYFCAEGEENSLEIIRDLAAGRIDARLVDIRFCNGGCIGGPGRNNRLTTFAKQTLIHRHFQRDDIRYSTSERYGKPPQIDFGRSFRNKYKRLDLPSSDSIRKILLQTNKHSEQDELDCGGCGYRTCREHAIAVYQGLADIEMCLPYSLKRLEEDRLTLTQKYELAQHALSQEFGDLTLVGKDSHTQEVLNLIHQVGPTPTTVLIRGESGTGKELTARAIHRVSPRTDKPLVTLNCTTLSDSLLESELFGHQKGAFTGAVSDKKGLFEAAHGGTIFLDEIGDISPKVQAELLRVLDSGEIRPVGGNHSKKVDVRLIAATNKNLEDGVREGWFREDLFYRLNVFSITMPPLRNRLDSLEELLEHFLRHTSKRVNKTITAIDRRAIEAMRLYHWPGNIRELQNIIERAAVLTQDRSIHLENLPVIFTELIGRRGQQSGATDQSLRQSLEQQISLIEKGLLKNYLEQAAGNVSAAARLAQMPRRSFYRLLERHQLHSAEQRSDQL
ncbi:MAG: sigma 54-interacting transcriptional regulator [Desulfuromonas thiophila]|jgi:transcriptional regulator with PAS, ATPase and Fis domain/iron only hydrogenase large subunit-like protein|nr:sigma 54-interacting transcriptional regulator [Desulfuromonas thiophila]